MLFPAEKIILAPSSRVALVGGGMGAGCAFFLIYKKLNLYSVLLPGFPVAACLLLVDHILEAKI